MKIFLISDNVDTLTGMRLAGIEGVVVHEKNEFLAALDRVYQDEEVGLVLITEKFSRDFPDIVNGCRAKHSPLFIDIPDRHGTGRSPDFITKYISEAIGLKL